MAESLDSYRERLLGIAKASPSNWLEALHSAAESVGGGVKSTGDYEMTVLVPACYVDDFRKLVEQIVPAGYAVNISWVIADQVARSS